MRVFSLLQYATLALRLPLAFWEEIFEPYFFHWTFSKESDKPFEIGGIDFVHVHAYIQKMKTANIPRPTQI
jgi:hypothetical protein